MRARLYQAPALNFIMPYMFAIVKYTACKVS